MAPADLVTTVTIAMKGHVCQPPRSVATFRKAAAGLGRAAGIAMWSHVVREQQAVQGEAQSRQCLRLQRPRRPTPRGNLVSGSSASRGCRPVASSQSFSVADPDSSSRLLLQSSSEGTSNARVVSSRVEGAAAAAYTQSISQDAVLQSQDMTCGICMETVSEKLDPRHQMFGILPNCTHSFCLQCIMTWRKTKDLGTDVVKTCPQCRVRSPFYVPNKYWVEGAAKESLIISFKKKFSRKSCSYYARYRCCPFKTECLYRHDKRPPHRTLQFSSDDEDEDFFDGIDLINFVMMSLFVTDEDLDLSSFDSEDFA